MKYVTDKRSGFGLIEMIGVLAIMTILAAIIVPSLVKQLDQVLADREGVALKAMGDAFKRTTLRNRYIPGYVDWAGLVAKEAGLSLDQVSRNPRNLPRYLLVDPNATPSLPYDQRSSGPASVPPSGVRIILLSSIQDRLINMSTNPTVADFSNIWNWNDSGTTIPATPLLNGLRRGEDLKIQRVNLDPLFVNLVLTGWPANGFYSIDDGAAVTNSGSGYFLQGTKLLLWESSTNALEQILNRDNSFVFYRGSWRENIFGAPPQSAGISGLATVVGSFLASPANQTLPDGQVIMVSSMIIYMQRYYDWYLNGFAHNATWSAAQFAQASMMLSIYNLYSNSIPPQVACPP